MSNIYKFNGMANDYSKYRPNYAKESVNYLIDRVQLTKNSNIADIGSGTGKFSRLLLDEGFKVFGVEPNDDMRQKAEYELQDRKKFISIAGTSENTTLSDHSIDLITVAQAFHWFDTEKFLIECNRILKGTGYVAILYNNGDYSAKVINAISELSKRYCPRYVGSSGGIEKNSTVFDNFFDEYTIKVFENSYQLNMEQFIGLNFSASYAPKINEPNHEVYLNSLVDLFEKYSEQNTLNMPNNTICRLGKVKKKV